MGLVEVTKARRLEDYSAALRNPVFPSSVKRSLLPTPSLPIRRQIGGSDRPDVLFPLAGRRIRLRLGLKNHVAGHETVAKG